MINSSRGTSATSTTIYSFILKLISYPAVCDALSFNPGFTLDVCNHQVYYQGTYFTKQFMLAFQ